MVKSINILGHRIKFVFRHRFEKGADFIDKFEWTTYALGIWFKKYKAIAKPKNGPAIIGQEATLTNIYMFGVNLILCKFWIDTSYRPLVLNLDNE